MAVLINPLASWVYEFDERAGDESNFFSLQGFASFTDKILGAVSILNGAGIFFPSRVALGSRWIRYEDGVRTPFDIHERNLETRSRDAEILKSGVSELVAQAQGTTGFCWPTKIEVFGRQGGPSFAESAEERLLITGQYDRIGWLAIYLHRTEWLPFSFDGKMPTEQYSFRAMRLEESMQAVESFLKVPALDEDNSRYCNVTGYRLSNFVDPDGEVIGLDELGAFTVDSDESAG